MLTNRERMQQWPTMNGEALPPFESHGGFIASSGAAKDVICKTVMIACLARRGPDVQCHVTLVFRIDQ